MILAQATILLGTHAAGGMDLAHVVARVLPPRFGRWCVGLVGAIVIVSGRLQLRLGITVGLRSTLRKGVSRLERIVVVVSGSIGYVTLGILSLIVGYSLIQVAVSYDPAEAGGWDKALWLLGHVSRAAGFWAWSPQA